MTDQRPFSLRQWVLADVDINGAPRLVVGQVYGVSFGIHRLDVMAAGVLYRGIDAAFARPFSHQIEAAA